MKLKVELPTIVWVPVCVMKVNDDFPTLAWGACLYELRGDFPIPVRMPVCVMKLRTD